MTKVSKELIDELSSDQLASNSVGTDEIATGAVDTDELAADAVDGTKIADNAVGGEHISLTSEASGSLMYYNGTVWVPLGIGSDSQILTVSSSLPSWSSPSAAETWTETDVGTGGSVEVSLADGYDVHEVLLVGIVSSSAASLTLQYYDSVGAAYVTSGYVSASVKGFDTTVTADNTFSTGQPVISYVSSNGGANSSGFIFTPDGTSDKTSSIFSCGGDASGSERFISSWVREGTAHDVTKFKLTLSSGTFSSGKVFVKGIKNGS